MAKKIYLVILLVIVAVVVALKVLQGLKKNVSVEEGDDLTLLQEQTDSEVSEEQSENISDAVANQVEDIPVIAETGTEEMRKKTTTDPTPKPVPEQTQTPAQNNVSLPTWAMELNKMTCPLRYNNEIQVAAIQATATVVKMTVKFLEYSKYELTSDASLESTTRENVTNVVAKFCTSVPSGVKKVVTAVDKMGREMYTVNL